MSDRKPEPSGVDAWEAIEQEYKELPRNRYMRGYLDCYICTLKVELEANSKALEAALKRQEELTGLIEHWSKERGKLG